MNELGLMLLYTVLSGSCIPLGGFLAGLKFIHPNWLEQEFRHFVIALGGGILLGALCVVLVPEGIASIDNPPWSIIIFLAGGLLCFAAERALGLRRRQSPQLMGMLLDYIPEAIALGGLCALQSPSALLLAALIGLQNLPEGFNAFRELVAKRRHSRGKTWAFMLSLVGIGPLAGLLGYFLLTDHIALLGGLMLFASGAILYLVFQDIAPQAHLERHWAPPLGAVLGFCVALSGKMLLGDMAGVHG